MMKHLLTIFWGLLFSAIHCFGQNKTIDSLMVDFKAIPFEFKVNPAKKALENYQQIIIPKIIPLLYKPTSIGLVDNPYLMYPANNNFEPTHGYFIPYNLDWISIRAGWLIEELTFMDFGYETELDEKKLAELYAHLYSPSSNSPQDTYLHWIDKPTKATLQKSRKAMANKVAAWWQQNKTNWTRINAIKEALKSDNKRRLLHVIEYLHRGETKCNGLTNEVYLQDIKPLVISIKNAPIQSIRDVAEQLLTDGLSNDIVSEKVN